jgi:hypothetical protein
VLTCPPRVSSAGLEAVELADSAGLHLDPWQCLVLEEALGERSDGKWSAFEVGLLVPRQNGKGSVLEARELAGLFLFDEKLILHSAHEFKTSSEAFSRIWSLIENTPDLERKVHKVYSAHGSEGITLKNGNRLRFVARTSGSGRGFSGDCVILDEAYKLTMKQIAALLPTLSARPNPQLWYTSSGGQLESDVLLRLRQRGVTGEKRLCFLEWSAEPDADLDDRAAWLQANPGFGYRIPEETMESLRAAMDDPEFALECLGIWENVGTSLVIPSASWQSCLDPRSRIDGLQSFAIDVAPDQTHASIAVGGRRSDGLAHVEIVENRPGTRWVARRCSELQAKWGGDILIDTHSPAGALLPDLEAENVRLRIISTAELVQSCGTFYSAVVAAEGEEPWLRHLGQPELAKALQGAVKRPVGDAWAWSRKNSNVDISPLVAVTMVMLAVANGGGVNLW